MGHDERSWAKMDSRLDSNPKVRRAGRNGREVFLFALRRNRLRGGGGANGRLPAADFEAWYLADQLMMPEADATDGLARALSAGLLAQDGDQVVICGFSEEWGGRLPLTPAERSQRYRDRHRSEERPTSRDDGDGRDASRAVTPPRDGRDASRRSEERRGEERESGDAQPPPIPPIPPGAPRRAPRRRPSTPMPDGWTPTAEHRARAMAAGVDLDREVARFTDHHAAKGSLFADWNAAFRTWLGRAEEGWSERRAPRAAGEGGVRRIEDIA